MSRNKSNLPYTSCSETDITNHSSLQKKRNFLFVKQRSQSHTEHSLSHGPNKKEINSKFKCDSSETRQTHFLTVRLLFLIITMALIEFCPASGVFRPRTTFAREISPVPEADSSPSDDRSYLYCASPLA